MQKKTKKTQTINEKPIHSPDVQLKGLQKSTLVKPQDTQ